MTEGTGRRVALVTAFTESSGGIYQYSLSLLAALEQRLGADRVVVVAEGDPDRRPIQGFHGRVTSVPTSLDERLRVFASRVAGPGRGRAIRARLRLPNGRGPAGAARFRSLLSREGIGFTIFGYPSQNTLGAAGPFAVAIHDLQHRLQPEFREVTADGEREERERILVHVARAATAMLVDSDLGREQLRECYGLGAVGQERIIVLPFVPPPYALDRPDTGGAVRARYRLPDRFLFYPAQFWPHKNHERIVSALADLRASGVEGHVVFVGGHLGPLRTATHRLVLRLAAEVGLRANVHDLGFVPDEDVAALYRMAVGLVMPTFFGPTNIPVVEAFALDCPVITSDLPGIREQAGDAALLVDPRSVASIAAAMRVLWSDERARAALVARGRLRLEALRREFDRGIERLIAVVESTAPQAAAHKGRAGTPATRDPDATS